MPHYDHCKCLHPSGVHWCDLCLNQRWEGVLPGTACNAGGSEEEEGTPEPAEPEKLDYEEGCLMRFDFVDANHELAYTDIRDTFQDIAYVEFQKANTST